MDVFQRVDEAIASQSWASVAGILDAAELESPSPEVLVEWPHALHLLAHVYNGELADARLVYKRIPDAAKQDNAELAAAFRVLQHLWQKDYQGTWGALTTPQWGVQAGAMAQALHAQLQRAMLALMGRAYASVTVPKAAALLGMSEAAALEAVQQAGWRYEAAAQMLHTDALLQKQAAAAAAVAAGGEGDTYADLQRLTEYVIHFQTQ